MYEVIIIMYEVIMYEVIVYEVIMYKVIICQSERKFDCLGQSNWLE